jgi:hypothetical protein
MSEKPTWVISRDFFRFYLNGGDADILWAMKGVAELDAVTGAFGYTGRFIARRLFVRGWSRRP